MKSQSSSLLGRRGWRKHKYGNEPVEVDGIRFHSKLEAKRWQELKLLERAGAITDLRRQVRYRLEVNGMLICCLIVDFDYREKGELVVEDAKGVVTPECSVKLKLMRACHGIDVRLVKK